jgi:hypothetical protein
MGRMLGASVVVDRIGPPAAAPLSIAERDDMDIAADWK